MRLLWLSSDKIGRSVMFTLGVPDGALLVLHSTKEAEVSLLHAELAIATYVLVTHKS